jgi:hypothetical protein
MNWNTLLGLSVVAALLTTIGTLWAWFSSTLCLQARFEKWKLHQSLREVSRKYGDPIALSAIELAKSFNAEKEKTTQPVITVRIESLLFFRSASMQAHRLRGVLDNVLDCGLESSQGFASARC